MANKIKRLELSEFLTLDDSVSCVISGTVSGLTCYKLDNGTISYAGVISNDEHAVNFVGGPGYATGGISNDNQIRDSTQRISVLKYSEQTGNNVYLRVRSELPPDVEKRLAQVNYASIHDNIKDSD